MLRRVIRTTGPVAETDVLVVGGGTGGVAAALAALRLGCSVVISEPTGWIGGQLTAQAVPPDEHRWVEDFGATASYRAFREAVRGYYRRHYPLTPAARADARLNPGQGLVSRLCFEPRVGVAVLEAMLAPHRSSGRGDLRLHTRPVAAETDGDRVTSVTLRSDRTGAETVVSAPYVIDATELGDVLELAGVEHVIGAESQDDTGELHALPGPPRPVDQQAVSWCFALDHRPGEDHTIERPTAYEHWRTHRSPFWPGPQLAWTDLDPETLEPRHKAIFDSPDWTLWDFRRILWAGHFPPGVMRSDITLVNWPHIDYWLGPLLGVDADAAAAHLEASRQLSLSFLHWMQTEAPRPDGGTGYPGLRLRPDVMGTEDGLAQHVYVRESRRIRAELTVLEEHVGVEQRAGRAGAGAEPFADAVGTGCYPIDLHPSTAGRTYVDINCYPFQIPLGALLPVRVENLLPGAKNLGVTHVTNGCYRLHPVEWNIGEAAGALAAHCLEHGLTPRAVRHTPARLAEFQALLAGAFGVTLRWPEHARAVPARAQPESRWPSSG